MQKTCSFLGIVDYGDDCSGTLVLVSIRPRQGWRLQAVAKCVKMAGCVT